jgi:hypothetical protein
MLLMTRSPRSFVVCKLSPDYPDMCLTLNCSDGRETMQVVKRVERSSSPNLVDIGYRAYPSFQNTNCGIASTNGSPHRIHQQTITSRVVLITRKPQRGFSKGTFTRNGNQKVPSCGFTESVRRVPIFYPILPDDVLIL